MASVSFGPALAGFPAFPLLPLDALANPESLPPEVLAGIQQTFQALDFRFTATSFSFELNSAIFGRPGDFDFLFTFTGDFASMASLPPDQVLAAFLPALSGNFLVRFQTAETRNLLTGDLAIAATADSLGLPISFLQFFATLLDPRNFTENLLQTFTGNLAQFDTLDLSAFTDGVISARPNGPTITTDGTISRPDGSFAETGYGVVSFDGEVLSLAFTTVIGGAGDDVLGAGAAATSIDGGAGADALFGAGAADTLEGGTGRDLLVGGRGHDMLSGGAGADVLVGGLGDDLLKGGGGDDVLRIGTGDDIAIGGDGADIFVVERAAGSVTTIRDFDRREGDRLDLPGGPWLPAGRFGREADGDLSLVFGPPGQSQKIIFEGLSRPSQVALLPFACDADDGVAVAAPGGGLAWAPGANGDAIGQDGNDTLFGRRGDNLLAGGDGRDALFGGAGGDVLLGQDGEDILRGQDGDDVLDGGAGRDTLVGGDGWDVVSGGFGADIFVLQGAATGYDRITDFELGADRFDIRALVGGQAVTPATFADHVMVVPLGPTELTGFVMVDRDGAGAAFGFEVVAQIDGAPFGIVEGVSRSLLGFGDFVL
jgi:Ca2+-binding RTX toxin-like protein